RPSIERSAHFGSSRDERVVVYDEHAEALEIVMPRGPQCKPVANALALLVGPRDHIQRQGKIAGASRHRADHCQIGIALQWRGWRGREPARECQPPPTVCPV